MFNFIKNYFVKQTPQQKAATYLSECVVEYRPLRNRYYPKHKNQYLFYDSLYDYESFLTEKEAWNFIDQFLEQTYAVGVVELRKPT